MEGLLELHLLNGVWNALVAVRSEIALFCLAFALHYLLLHRNSRSSKDSRKIEKVVEKVVSVDESAPFGNDPQQVLERSQAAHCRGDHRAVLKCWGSGGLRTSSAVPAAHLAQIVESMQRFKKDSKSILSEVTAYLENKSNSSSVAYMNRLLEPLAKSLDVEVVEGIVKLFPSLGLQADAQTFEILIHMHFTTRSFKEISALATQLKSDCVTPSQHTTLMLLKSALHTGNLDEALECYRSVAPPDEAMPPTVSEAPAHIAAQLVELACRLHRAETVLPDLESSKMPLTTDMVNMLLTESSHARNADLHARVEMLATNLRVGRNGRTYERLVCSAGSDRAKISELLDDMVANNVPCTQELSSAVLSACTSGKDIGLADRLLSQLARDPQGQAAIFQALVRFYADAGEPAKACEVFDRHLSGRSSDRRVPLDTRTERSLVSAAVQCGREDLASLILEAAPSDTAKHISLIRTCAAKGNLREAMSTFQRLQTSGAQITQSLWNTALDACVECRDLQQASLLMKEMEAIGMADAVTYNTLIKAHLRLGSQDTARGIMEKMRKAGCAPNQVTYNEIINALVRNARGLQAAWEIVEEMKRDGVQPNRITCSILLKSLHAKSAGADISRAMELTSQMDEVMDEVLMSSVVEACVRVGKPALLSQKLADLHRHGGITVTGAQTFGSLIKAYGHAHDIDGVWSCWKEMRSRHVKPTSITIGCMVEAVATSGDVDGAYELIGQLLEDEQCKDQVNAVIFGSVVKGYGRMRRMERVFAILEDMRSHGIQPSLATFNAVIDGCTRSARMDAVPQLIEDMAKRDLRPNLITYSTMIKGFCQHGDMPTALATLREMRQTPELKPDGVVYNTILEGCSQAGLVVEGERLFSKMQEEGIAPTNYTLTVMVRLMGQARRADHAFELVESLTHKHRFRANAHVFNALIHACIVSQDLERAMAVFEHMSGERQVPDSGTRKSLVRDLLAVGCTIEAASVVSTVLQITSQPGRGGADQQQNNWGPQDDSALSDTLGALVWGGKEGVRHAKQLLAEVRASNSKALVDPGLEKKVLMA